MEFQANMRVFLTVVFLQQQNNICEHFRAEIDVSLTDGKYLLGYARTVDSQFRIDFWFKEILHNHFLKEIS